MSTLIGQFTGNRDAYDKPKAQSNVMFDHIEEFEDPTYLINQLYYTDSEKAINSYLSEVTRGRQNWLQDAYRDFLPEHFQRRGVKINNLMSNEASLA